MTSALCIPLQLNKMFLPRQFINQIKSRMISESSFQLPTDVRHVLIDSFIVLLIDTKYRQSHLIIESDDY